MTISRTQARLERAADAAADRARRAPRGQRIRTQVLAEIARSKALDAGNKRVRKGEA